VNSLAIFFSILVAGPIASAGGRTVGNGGDVLECKETGQSKSYELLDFYEGRTIRHWPRQMGSKDGSVKNKIQFVLKNLERLSPERARKYMRQASRFTEDTLFLEGANLEDISDSDHIAIPRKCRIRQIANQSEPVLETDKRYVIDATLWRELDSDNQAGLILHEIIYREALELGHSNSVSVRLLNALISSSHIQELSVEQFTRILIDLGFEHTSMQGVEISFRNPKTGELAPPEFYSSGLLKRAFVRAGSTYKWRDQLLKLRGEVRFYPKGQIESLTLADEQELMIYQTGCRAAAYEMQFYPSGDLAAFTLARPQSFQTDVYSLMLDGAVEFHSTGVIKMAEVLDGQVKEAKANPQNLNVNGVVQLDRFGNILTARISKEFRLPVNKQNLTWIGPIEFAETRIFVSGMLAHSQSLDVLGQELNLAPYYIMRFHANGFPKSACLMQGRKLKSTSGTEHQVEDRKAVEFNSSGLLIKNSYYPDC